MDETPVGHIPGDPFLASGPARAPRPAGGQAGVGKARETPPRALARPGSVGPNGRTRSVAPAALRLVLAVTIVSGTSVAVAGTGGSDLAVVPDASSVVDTELERRRVLVSDPANAAIVSAIAGDLLVVESLVPPGENGHTYEPVPADAVRAATADLYIENGMELNEAVSRFVRANYRAGTPEVILSEAIPTAEVISTDSAAEIAAHGHAHSFNAHFWTDPVYAVYYAEDIVEALVRLTPENEYTLRSRATEFIARLRILDDRFRAAIASIPPQNRKLVVYHDSWSYFGRRYGIPIVGAIQPVTFAEPSAEEIRRMIDQIRAEAVPAFFGSEVFPSDVLDAIARETGARYFSDLSDEELPGVPGNAEHSYEGMMIRNVRLITEALGGDIGLLADLVPGAAS